MRFSSRDSDYYRIASWQGWSCPMENFGVVSLKLVRQTQAFRADQRRSRSYLAWLGDDEYRQYWRQVAALASYFSSCCRTVTADELPKGVEANEKSHSERNGCHGQLNKLETQTFRLTTVGHLRCSLQVHHSHGQVARRKICRSLFSISGQLCWYQSSSWLEHDHH